MKKTVYKLCLMAITAIAVSTATVFGQGVTTSSMTGSVYGSTTSAAAERKIEEQEQLPGATIQAVHTPSGTQYGAATSVTGRYSIPNMRVGGPYKITVSYIGYQSMVYDDVYLKLGEAFTLNVVLELESSQLSEIIVTANRDNLINSGRTGASTTISNQQVQSLPTVSRGFNDFTRLTPQVEVKGSSISIAGMNNRYNQVTIDGAVSNDVFGLSDTGTNGGATGTSPISLDAIEEFTVKVAPFDVRYGGFAGGGISAVTRSGTNEVQGSAYYFFRNENLAGKTPGKLLAPGAEAEKFNAFSDRQFGVRVGGPIIKDKLFYFVNIEQTEAVTPISFAPGGTDGSEITVAEAEAIRARAIQLGYDPGSFSDQESTNNSQKIFARIDYNISDKHKATIRHSYTYGDAIQLGRTPRVLTFSNGGVLRESKTNSTVVEINSRFSNKVSNNLVAGYTTVREPRSAPGAPFPRVAIRLDGQRTINLGTEAFSTVNNLEQDIFTLTNNLNVYAGNHTFTFGTHNEYYNMYNAFIGQAYGDYVFQESPASDVNPATGNPYSAIENWQRGSAFSMVHGYSTTANFNEGADFRALQLGFYAQDEYQMNDNLRFTAGLRLDIPVYLDNPLENTNYNNSILAIETSKTNNTMPSPQLMWSPRLGFNWDVFGDQKTQIRGGTGIFTSRFPFVWAGGAFTQNGVSLTDFRIVTPANTAPQATFNPDPFGQEKRPAAAPPGGRMTLVDNNFKLPQIARTNIAIDQKLPGGFVATAEFMYSQNLNAFRFTNLNLVDATDTLSTPNGTGDNRLRYPAASRRVGNYSEVIYIDNVNAGRAYSWTFQLQKSYSNGFFGSVAYNYTNSTDLFPGTSSQNHSNYYRVASVNGSNNAEVASSPFDTRNRITAVASYRKEYLGFMATTISLFYNGQTGAPFSYVVAGDLNRSTYSGSNNDHFSLIYIPRDASEITFVPLTVGTGADAITYTPEEQWTNFNQFIESQPYLNERRGQYAERNGARTPFTHRFDLKIAQDIFTNVAGKRNTVQITFDVLNFGNLINKDWGNQYTFGDSFFDNTVRVLQLAGFDGNTPQYRYNPIRNNEPWTLSDAPIGGSRWVGQIGVRYIFN